MRRMNTRSCFVISTGQYISTIIMRREVEGFKRYSFPWFLMMHDDIYLVKRYVARCFITWLYTTYGITYGKYFLELNYTRFHFVSPDTRHIREKKNFYGDSIFFS